MSDTPDIMPKLVPVETLHAMQLPPLAWLLAPFVVAEEGILLLHGRWGTYKTPLAYAMGAAVATGAPLWGLPSTKGRVLFLQADTPRRVFLDRAKELSDIYHVRESFDHYFCYPGFDALACTAGGGTAIERALFREVTEAHKRQPYSLVIVDSLRTMHILPDKDSEVPPQVYRALQRMFPGASLILIHHDRKLKADESVDMALESFSGSQAWANHATVALKVVKGGKNEVFLVQTKSQAGPMMQEPLGLTMDGNRASLAVETVALIAGTGLSGRALDTKLASVLGVSTRTARRRRAQVSPRL